MWVMAGERVVRLGDQGAHEVKSVTKKEARECWDLTKFILDDLGLDMIDFGEPLQAYRISSRYSLGPVPRWQGPVEFKETVNGLERGGLLDLLYRCPECRTIVFVEDVQVSFPDPDGVSDAGQEEVCRKCGLTFDVSVVWEPGGWWAEAEKSGDGGDVTLGRKPPHINRPLPAIGSFLYREMVDFQDRENEFIEWQLEHG
jgi:hypothetical protein